MKIEARFIGADGSLGYLNGEHYILTVALKKRRVSIMPEEFHRHAEPCEYAGLRAFLNNWQVIKDIDLG